MPTERNHQIRERAYGLWEADGRPEGKDIDYWLRAERDLNIGETRPSRKAKGTVKSTSAKAAKAGLSTKKAASRKTSSKRAATKKAPAAKP